jgi:hypothetical protein
LSVDEISDRLYGLPAAEFVSARDAAARELRQAGLRAEAESVKELRKPTAAAAATNRLVRERRREVEAFLAAAKTWREAQVGQGDVRAAGARERALLEQLVDAGGEGVRQSLQAAAVDSGAAQELLAGRLERELEPRGFGTLTADLPPAAARKPRPPSAAATKKAPDGRRAREKLADAKRTLAAAEAEARRAKRQWQSAEAEVQRARKAVEKAQADLERVRH